MSKLAVIYYSATGHGTELAQRVAAAAEAAGADVRVRQITGPENNNPLDDATQNALDHLARRVINVADQLADS